MGKRTFTEFNPQAPVLSGALEHTLPEHVKMRAFHFFMFCTTVQLICDVLEATQGGSRFLPPQVIELHATHQGGTGYRMKTMEPFNKHSKSMATEQGTGAASMDAAHFNNLGLKPAFLSWLDTLIGNSVAPFAAMLEQLRDDCVTYCADTRLLPQRINLVPDKIIDEVHRKIAMYVFRDCAAPSSSSTATYSPSSNPHPCLSQDNIDRYVDIANNDIESKYSADEKKNLHPDYMLATLYKPGLAELKVNLYNGMRPGIEGVIYDINSGLPPGILPLNPARYIGPHSVAGKPPSDARVYFVAKRKVDREAARLLALSKAPDGLLD